MRRPRRVVVYGSPGSGKSWLAARLAGALQVPHVELDGLTEHPGHPDLTALRAAVDAEVARDGWVIEGMYRDELRRALYRADALVWLDVRAARVAVNLGRRTLALLLGRQERHGRRVTARSLVREELPFLAKSVRRHRHRRRYARDLVEACGPAVHVVHLRSRRAVRRFLAGVDGPHRHHPRP